MFLAADRRKPMTNEYIVGLVELPRGQIKRFNFVLGQI
jgi:hypothetical protein